MALSRRGQAWATLTPDLLIWQVIKDLWDPKDNPEGYVSLGVAENGLMHEQMAEYVNKHVELPANGLTYGDGGTGSKKLQKAMAHFLTRKLNPVLPIEPSHLCITNGVSCGIEHLSDLFADRGDVFLLGQPHYGAFIADIELRPEVKVVQVSFGSVDPLSLEAVDAYEKAIELCKAKGQRVAGLMLCNPHNPLGRCYSREYIIELMKLCQKHQVHLISDEIYALSVWRTSGEAEEDIAPFTSLSSIPTDGLIDPALTHILYGLSKDFGANGLRLGCIVSQHNLELHKALIPVAIYSYASSLVENVAAKLLADDAFVDWYAEENCRRLKQKYEVVTAWADARGIEYAKGVNSAFFLWVNLGKVYSEAVQAGKVQARNAGGMKNGLRRVNCANEQTHVHEEQVCDGENGDIYTQVNNALLEQKVFLASGATFGSEKTGWFRIVFSQNDQNLQEGLRRIDQGLGLSKSLSLPIR